MNERDDKNFGSHFGNAGAHDAHGAHFAGARHTRDSLEGAVNGPVAEGPEGLDSLRSGAEGVRPSVSRTHRERTGLDSVVPRLDEEFEPKTRVSSHLNGTAVFRSAGDGGEPGQDLEPAGKSPRRRIPIVGKVLIVLLAVLLVVAAAAWAWIASLESSMSIKEEDRAELEEVLVEPSEVQGEAFYALIIGSDARTAGETSRSDVIMLARVDVTDGCITLISIPRDTMISGTMSSVEKINAEYNYGPAATVRAVSKFAGVDISHYVEVSFEGLEQVVDALGGVTVDIPENISAGNGGFSFTKGEQLLNGEQALAYARERYNVSGGDFGRAQAQRQIVQAIVSEVLASGPTEMPGLITKLAESISTDLSVPDIISYALDLQGSSSSLTMYSAATPSYALNQGGVSYVATMYDEWREMMQRVDAGLDPNDESAQIPEEQRQNERLGSAENGAGPRDYEELAANSLTTDDVA